MKIKPNKLKVTISIILILILAFSGLCIAKYKVTSKIIGGNKVAVPVLIVEGTEEQKISALNNTGTYSFIVKNYNNEQVSDVAQKYSIEIITNSDDAIQFKLYRENEEIELENKKTEPIYIGNTNEEEHEYELKISYDRTKNISKTDILEDVQLKIHSEQERL